MYLINKDETEHTGQVRDAALDIKAVRDDQRSFSRSSLVHHTNPLVLHKSSRMKKQCVGWP